MRPFSPGWERHAEPPSLPDTSTDLQEIERLEGGISGLEELMLGSEAQTRTRDFDCRWGKY